MASIAGRNAADAGDLGQDRYGRVDKSQIQLGEPSIELSDTPVLIPGKVGHVVVAVEETSIEDVPSLRAKPVPEEMVDLGNDGGGNNQAARLGAKDRARARVPRVAPVVVGVDDPGVQQDGH